MNELETEINVREKQFRTNFMEYKETNCGHRGRQKSNLTRSQQSQLKSTKESSRGKSKNLYV